LYDLPLTPTGGNYGRFESEGTAPTGASAGPNWSSGGRGVLPHV